MAQDSSSNRPMPENYRCDHTEFTKEQLKTHINTFNQMTYPGYATKQRLALEVNAEESRIQIWFQNSRARYPFWKRGEHKEALESSQTLGKITFQNKFQVKSSNGAVPPTAPLSCTPSSRPSGTTLPWYPLRRTAC
ncbi:Double homeobox protein A [Sciurus carolinensis]|uniref:Double homeobox protein A n=1 Tax=Sciurus carolinensis TaxID=30640 RepID=A0AA41MYC6_SCICA|nr:Double homeobox protein A [Sciurus carolinensis]